MDPPENPQKHAKKIETAIKKAAKATTSDSRSAKKLWITGETLNLAGEKRMLKQTKSASTQKEQEYKNLCKKVKKSARQDKER